MHPSKRQYCIDIEQSVPFFLLPNGILKVIIKFWPYRQWFLLCKQISTIALQALSPLDYRRKDGGSFCWALRNNKLLAVTSLLRDPRVDPSLDKNYAIRYASGFGYDEIVEILLKDDRVDPSAFCNSALRFASQNGHKKIVELLLQGTLQIVLEILSQHCSRLFQ